MQQSPSTLKIYFYAPDHMIPDRVRKINGLEFQNYILNQDTLQLPKFMQGYLNILVFDYTMSAKVAKLYENEGEFNPDNVKNCTVSLWAFTQSVKNNSVESYDSNISNPLSFWDDLSYASACLSITKKYEKVAFMRISSHQLFKETKDIEQILLQLKDFKKYHVSSGIGDSFISNDLYSLSNTQGSETQSSAEELSEKLLQQLEKQLKLERTPSNHVIVMNEERKVSSWKRFKEKFKKTFTFSSVGSESCAEPYDTQGGSTAKKSSTKAATKKK